MTVSEKNEHWQTSVFLDWPHHDSRARFYHCSWADAKFESKMIQEPTNKTQPVYCPTKYIENDLNRQNDVQIATLTQFTPGQRTGTSPSEPPARPAPSHAMCLHALYIPTSKCVAHARCSVAHYLSWLQIIFTFQAVKAPSQEYIEILTCLVCGVGSKAACRRQVGQV